ncbi:MAG TPA: hypothetical protein V6D05_11830 [Stenomitos sp.]
MAVNLGSPAIAYPPNSRPQSPSYGMAAGAPAVVRVPQMRSAAALSSAKGGGLYKPSFGGTLRQLLSPFSFVKTAGISALFSFPLAAISNFMDMQQGNLTQKQFMVNTVADGFAYTATGTLSSMVGALVGTLIPIPFLGTMIGMLGGVAVGALLGKLYDDQVRPHFRQNVESTMTQAGLV